MQPRMRNPALIVPDAMQALQMLAKATDQQGVPARTLGLMHLRASQINGCSVCVDMHRFLKKDGETDERLMAVAAWTRHAVLQRRGTRRARADGSRDAAQRSRGSRSRRDLG